MSTNELSDRRAAYAERLEAALVQIVERLSAVPEVRRISVFGSFARGRRDLFTDLDVLVILDTVAPVPERLARLYAPPRYRRGSGPSGVDAGGVGPHADASLWSRSTRSGARCV